MAKRAAADEQPYRPLLDPGLMSAALAQVAPGATPVDRAPKGSEVGRGEAVKHLEAFPPVAQVSVPKDDLRPSDDVQREVFVEKFDQEKRILFTRKEGQAIDRLVTSLAARLNSQVKVSHLVRALVGLALRAEAQVDRRAGEVGPIVRPPNGDAQALQRYERQIASIVAAALRDAGPFG